MDSLYRLLDPTSVASPALLFYKELIERNLAHCLKLAGSPERLRPHVKTHKTREIVRLQLRQGIVKHKCATIAEAELLASSEVPDVLISYPLVGPNCQRLGKLIARYPTTRFRVLIDHPQSARALAEVLSAAGLTVDVLVDLDVGQHRTGITLGPEATKLYELADKLPGLTPAGLHAYDGHNHQESRAEREAAVQQLLEPVLQLRASLEKKGLPVPRVVAGGTPTFPIYAALDIPGLECSPGTFVLHDHGYGSKYADLAGFTPAAALLTRVVSRPTSRCVTFDLGTKAVASDPPAGRRARLLTAATYEAVGHNEEHFIIETEAAEQFQPGDVAYAIPAHICPTCALHKQALVVEGGRVMGAWDIVARDRMLTV